jgi:hypothetical protein
MAAKIIAIVKSKGILATQTTSPPDFSWLVKRIFKDPVEPLAATELCCAARDRRRRDCSTRLLDVMLQAQIFEAQPRPFVFDLHSRWSSMSPSPQEHRRYDR